MPVSMGSAVKVLYKERELLLTVQHVTGEGQEQWCIECYYDEARKETALKPLSGINYLAIMDINKLIKHGGSINPRLEPQIDFAWVEYPKDTPSYYQDIDLSSKKIISQEERTFIKTDLDTIPNKSDEYYFSGFIRGEIDDKIFKKENPFYDNFHYIRSYGDYHIFSIPFENPSYNMFKGCSGAPIVNQSGQLVSLVCGGNIDNKELYGMNLNKRKLEIDIVLSM